MKRGRSSLDEYEERAAKLGPADVQGWKSLGHWAKMQGLSAQWHEAYGKVMAMTPDDADARQALGYVQVQGQWMTEEESYRARGFVKYQGEWMTPAEVQMEQAGVAAAEARHGQRSSSLRMGIQVPLSVRADVNQPATVMFKDVGTNLDCMATVLDAGRFRLDLSLEQGSLAAGGWEAISSTPVLRTFRSSSSLFLSDGQTSRYVAATDPVSGEVLQVDVTLNVVK